jgi:hypothetical protein
MERGRSAGRVVTASDEESTSGVSRRDALKKIGIGAGIAWSAPVVLSFYNAAGAATGSPDNSTTTTAETLPPLHPECTGAACMEFDPGCSSTNPDCICVSTPDPSVSFCVPGATVCEVGPVCAPDLTCPPGMFCAINTCCGFPDAPFSVCTPFSIAVTCPPDEQPASGNRAPKRTRVKTGAGTFGG